MSKRRTMALAALVAGAVALALTGGLVQMRAALAQELESLQIASRVRQFAGRQEGEVVLGDRVVLRLRTPAAGLTAAQRAEVVATRLDTLMRTNPLAPEEFYVALAGGQYVVMARDEILVTADPRQAALNNLTPQQLAFTWRDNLAAAVTDQVAVAGLREELVAENVSDRIVPIVSLGSGVRVGAARITGPAARVDEASVVGQVDVAFQDAARIRIFVPLRSITALQRVPQVNVTAYGDIRL